MYIINTNRDLEVQNGYRYLNIDDLEPTGCVVLNLIFNDFDSAFFQIDENVNLYLLNIRLLCEFKDGTFEVKEVTKENTFSITVDKESIYKVKLLFIADVNYPSNQEIPVSLISKESLKKVNKLETNNLKFTLKVLKNK
tara:strand:+ start:14 stop:430 length:417 start_codon:yes stop_codon:yes gene_type:complete